ncbi:MAG: hypothetical protein IKG93_13210 [Clostridiales bacterium]|nr:hypothetical protein [Clostridiales bacterium]
MKKNASSKLGTWILLFLFPALMLALLFIGSALQEYKILTDKYDTMLKNREVGYRNILDYAEIRADAEAQFNDEQMAAYIDTLSNTYSPLRDKNPLVSERSLFNVEWTAQSLVTDDEGPYYSTDFVGLSLSEMNDIRDQVKTACIFKDEYCYIPVQGVLVATEATGFMGYEYVMTGASSKVFSIMPIAIEEQLDWQDYCKDLIERGNKTGWFKSCRYRIWADRAGDVFLPEQLEMADVSPDELLHRIVIEDATDDLKELRTSLLDRIVIFAVLLILCEIALGLAFDSSRKALWREISDPEEQAQETPVHSTYDFSRVLKRIEEAEQAIGSNGYLDDLRACIKEMQTKTPSENSKKSEPEESL